MDAMGKGSSGAQELLAIAMWGAHRLIHLLLHQPGAGLNLGPPGKHHCKIKLPHLEPKSCLEQLALGRNALGDVHISNRGSGNGVLEVLLGEFLVVFLDLIKKW